MHLAVRSPPARPLAIARTRTCVEPRSPRKNCACTSLVVLVVWSGVERKSIRAIHTKGTPFGPSTHSSQAHTPRTGPQPAPWAIWPPIRMPPHHRHQHHQQPLSMWQAPPHHNLYQELQPPAPLQTTLQQQHHHKLHQQLRPQPLLSINKWSNKSPCYGHGLAPEMETPG